MEKLFTWIRHNTPLTIGLLLCIAVGVYGYGCQSTGPSVLRPGEQVTAAELQIEVNALQGKHETDLDRAELSLAEIKKKDEIKQRVFAFGAATVETGKLNPLGIIGLVGYILGVSAYTNGRKKDVIIKRDENMLAKANGTS